MATIGGGTLVRKKKSPPWTTKVRPRVHRVVEDALKVGEEIAAPMPALHPRPQGIVVAEVAVRKEEIRMPFTVRPRHAALVGP